MSVAATFSVGLALTTFDAPLPNTNWIGQNLCLGLWRASISEPQRETWPASESRVEAGGLRATHTLIFEGLGEIEVEESVIDLDSCEPGIGERINANVQSDRVATRTGCVSLASGSGLGTAKSLRVHMRYTTVLPENLRPLLSKVATAQACERSRDDARQLLLGPLISLAMPSGGF